MCWKQTKKGSQWLWINELSHWVKVCAAKCTPAPNALNGLFCILGGGKLGSVSAECRKKLLSGFNGRLQATCKLAGYSLSKNIADGRKSSTYRTCNLEPRSKWDGATPDEGQHRLSLHKSKNQHTLSPQTENSPTLLKTAKEKKPKNEALAIVSKILKAKQNLEVDWFSFSQIT